MSLENIFKESELGQRCSPHTEDDAYVNGYEICEIPKTIEDHLYGTLRLTAFRTNNDRFHKKAEKYLEKYLKGKKQNPNIDEVLNVAKESFEEKIKAKTYRGKKNG